MLIIHPQLCFDEGHHNLSVTRGRYVPVLRLFESDGLAIVHLKGKFTKKNLRSCKLLYISAALGADFSQERKLAARSAFQENEITAINDWVKNGGGLLIATDHRPMGDTMQPLLKKFGVEGSLINIKNTKKPIQPFTEPGIFEISGDMLSKT